MSQKLHFSKFVCSGNPYEVGLRLGELIKQNPQLKEINIMKERLDDSKLKSKLHLLQQFSPNIVEEAQGMSESLKIPIGNFTAFSDEVFSVGACSQVVAFPQVTDSKNLLVGRSYEWTPYDELNLAIVNEAGYPSHIGFSLFIFGRMDGINAKGLVITMSSCEFGQQSFGEGIWFPLLLRVILDNCSSVDEAVYLLRQFPIRCSSNILIADKQGDAIVAEIACYGKDRKISFRRNDKYLISTNHYINQDMLKYDNHHGNHSEIRYKAIEETLESNIGNISERTIKNILSAKVPNGVCCPYYDDGLGTLRSMFFNTAECKVDVCFGSPEYNSFDTMSFSDEPGISLFDVKYVNEYAENPGDFWKVLLPGGEK